MDSFLQGFTQAFSLIIHLDPELLKIILLSLEVSGIALVIASTLGIPAGSILGLKHFRGRGRNSGVVIFAETNEGKEASKIVGIA